MAENPHIAVLGASGLIGKEIVSALLNREFAIVAIARKFTSSQRNEFAGALIERFVVDMDVDQLRADFRRYNVDIVVNCIGVLQSPEIENVHTLFVSRILTAMTSEMLLVQISIPAFAQDTTAFACSKRSAEDLISASLIPFAILRPGFVIARAAFGGSALVRALAALPIGLSHDEMARPFMVTAVEDIVETVAKLTAEWRSGKKQWREIWDVMSPESLTIGAVVSSFRRHFGGPQPLVAIPRWLTSVAARCGDVFSWLGWRPPLRSVAIEELRRGVAGNPEHWRAQLGIQPATLADALRTAPANVQEKWFARLYLLKALILISLVMFWCISGLIALIAAFDAASAILVAHGFSKPTANALTVISSMMDISVGIAIGIRRTCRFGLLAGIAVSLFYMLGAAFLAPDIWFEPLGALVKTFPAIVLMIVALALLPDR